MEKVKLTKEQALELESMKEMGYNVEQWYRNKMNPIHPYSVIHDLSIDDFAKVFYSNEYEVEQEQPEFKPGDKVIVTWNKGEPTLHEVQDVRSKTVYINTKPPHVYNSNPPKTIVRHATPEEIYWLETLGREKVRDYQYGDILTNSEHIPFVIANKTDTEAGFIQKECAEEYRRKLDLKGLLPAQAFKRFPVSDSKK